MSASNRQSVSYEASIYSAKIFLVLLQFLQTALDAKKIRCNVIYNPFWLSDLLEESPKSGRNCMGIADFDSWNTDIENKNTFPQWLANDKKIPQIFYIASMAGHRFPNQEKIPVHYLDDEGSALSGNREYFQDNNGQLPKNIGVNYHHVKHGELQKENYVSPIQGTGSLRINHPQWYAKFMAVVGCCDEKIDKEILSTITQNEEGKRVDPQGTIDKIKNYSFPNKRHALSAWDKYTESTLISNYFSKKYHPFYKMIEKQLKKEVSISDESSYIYVKNIPALIKNNRTPLLERLRNKNINIIKDRIDAIINNSQWKTQGIKLFDKNTFVPPTIIALQDKIHDVHSNYLEGLADTLTKTKSKIAPFRTSMTADFYQLIADLRKIEKKIDKDCADQNKSLEDIQKHYDEMVTRIQLFKTKHQTTLEKEATPLNKNNKNYYF